MTGMLCNPKFINKNKSVFQSKPYIFPLPTHIFTKDGKTGNACFHQAELTLCFHDHVLVLLCLLRSIKRTTFANLCMRVLLTSETVHSKASLTLEIFGEERTTQGTDK